MPIVHQFLPMYPDDTLCVYSDHDLEERTYVQGFEGAGEYAKSIQYRDPDGLPLSREQVRKYAEASYQCKQYISWECFSAGIHHPEEVCTVFRSFLHQISETSREDKAENIST